MEFIKTSNTTMSNDLQHRDSERVMILSVIKLLENIAGVEVKKSD